MEEIELQATPAGLPILQAWNFVKEHGKSNKKRWKNAPLVGLNANWSKVVIDKDSGTVNHRAYTFWMLEQALEALHRHDLYIVGSEKYVFARNYYKVKNGKVFALVFFAH